MKQPLSVIVRIIIILLFTISCGETRDKNIYSSYKPILIESNKVNICELEGNKLRKNISQLRTMGNYLLALDYGLGIHIIDNSTPSNPIKMGFYNIPACIDFEVKNNFIFANNYKDFITVDFSNISSPSIIKRELNTFDIKIKTPDNLQVYEGLRKIPSNAIIISYEKI